MLTIRVLLCFILFFLPGAPLLAGQVEVIAGAPLLAGQVEVIAGAGPSTQIVKIFFKELHREQDTGGYRFIVPEQSAKHRGGIINADNFMFGRTGRPLANFERNLGKREIILAKVPVAFVTGEGVPRVRFAMEDIRKIFQRQTINWSAFGGSDVPIELVGRERQEAIFLSLKNEFPFFKQVTFDRVFHRDNEVMDFLASPSGKYAISFGAASNFTAKDRADISDFNVGIEVGLVYDVVNDDHPIVLAVKEYSASDKWKRCVRDAGMIPID